MAITKTSKIKRIHIYPAEDDTAGNEMNSAHPSIEITSEITVDDEGNSSDYELPIKVGNSHRIYRYVFDGGHATDISNLDSLVQSIAGAIWT